jgi:hypothetical protein
VSPAIIPVMTAIRVLCFNLDEHVASTGHEEAAQIAVPLVNTASGELLG